MNAMTGNWANIIPRFTHFNVVVTFNDGSKLVGELKGMPDAESFALAVTNDLGGTAYLVHKILLSTIDTIEVL